MDIGSHTDFSSNAIFHDRSLFDAEMKQLFYSGWTFAGMADQLPAPETWFVYEAWDRSIIVARDRTGRLHACVNSCAHRGTRLCKPGSAGYGRIRCPYHGWVYECSGKLAGAWRRAGLPHFTDEDYGLVRVSVDQAGRFLFVNSSWAPALTLREALGVKAALLDRISEHEMLLFFEDRRVVNANWKLAVCGALEEYHLPFVHPRSFNRGRVAVGHVSITREGHSSFSAPRADHRALKFLRRLRTQQTDGISLDNDLIFPNLLLVRIVNFVHLTAFIPLDLGRTLRISRLYGDAPRRPWVRRMIVPFVRRAVERGYVEDCRIVEEAHLGTGIGRDRRIGPTHVEEVRVESFLREIAGRLAGDKRSG